MSIQSNLNKVVSDHASKLEVGKPRAMGLRVRVLVVITLTLTVIYGLRSFWTRNSVMDSVARIEREEAKREGEQIASMIAHRAQELENNAFDWSNWTDLYNDVREPTRAFAQQNYIPNQLKILRLNVMMIHSTSGQKLFASKYDLENNVAEELNQDEYSELLAKIPGAKGAGIVKPVTGIECIRGKWIAFSCQPLHRSDGSGQPRGTIFFAQLLSSSVIDEIGAQVHRKISLTPPATTFDQSSAHTLTGSKTHIESVVNLDNQVVAISIPNSAKSNFLIIYTTIPRVVSSMSNSMAQTITVTSIILGVFVVIAVYWVIDRLVLRRLTQMHREIVSTNLSEVKSFQVTEGVHDEIGHLARTINALLVAKDESSRAVHQAHRELSYYLSALPFILVIFDYEGRVMTFNTKASEVFDEVLREGAEVWFWELPLGLNREVLHEYMLLAWTYDEPLNLPTSLIETAEGMRYHEILFNRINMDNGTGCFLLSAIDVTNQYLLQSQLSQAQKLESIGLLAAGIAHEINTPTQYVTDNVRFLKDASDSLIRVLAYNEEVISLLEERVEAREIAKDMKQVFEKEDVKYFLEEIPSAFSQAIDGLNRIASIVRAMKEFSHPGEDVKTYVDINHGIESTVSVSRNEWKYVADINLNLDPSSPHVYAFANEINQVILNLIVNAAHAIEDFTKKHGGKGLITITTHSLDSGMVEIVIEDTGGGIPESIKSRVFDPFFTTKEIGKGTGQGLAIAHNIIVKHHQGTINFDSAPGQGTTFKIILPAGDEVSEEEAA